MLSLQNWSRTLAGVLGILWVPFVSNADFWELINPEIADIRLQTARFEEKLIQLGPMPLGTTTVELGSQYHMAVEKPDSPPWILLDLGSSREFDKIMIVPAITRMDLSGSVAYAFPKSFHIEVSDHPKFKTSRLVEQFTDTRFEAKEGLPFVIDTPNTKARYLRITITDLPQLAGRYTFALGEILVLNGNLNLSAGAKAVMYMAPQIPPNWHPDFLIDGRTPLGEPIEIDLPEFDGAYSGAGTRNSPSFMELDFGEPLSIDEIRLHPIHARQGASLPGYGFPRKYQISVAETDSDDYITLFDSGTEWLSNPGNNPVYLPVSNVKA